MRNCINLCWICALACAIISGAWAEDLPPDGKSAFQYPESMLNTGVGFVFRTPVYKDQSSDIIPIPLVYYQQDKFFFRGNRVGYSLFRDQQLSINLIAEWMFRGYDASDSRYLRGMDDRDGSIEGGISASFKDGWGVSTVRFVTDMLGRHDGQELTFSYGKPFIKMPWTLIPSAGVAFGSRDLTNYYYGVRLDEATSVRPPYSPGQSYYPFAALTAVYRFNEKWSSTLSLRCDWLDSEITDSPIVDKHYQIKAIGGLTYTF